MFGSALPVGNVRTSAWLISGVIGLVGGMMLCGLGFALRVLTCIAERLEMQPLPAPPVAAIGREDPVPSARARRSRSLPSRPRRLPPPSAPKPALFGWLRGKKGAKSAAG